MLTSLDLLVIVSMALIAFSLLAVLLMFLSRRPRLRMINLCIVSVLGVLFGAWGVQMFWFAFPFQLALSVLFGSIGIAAIVLAFAAKGSEKKLQLARVLAAISLLPGMINFFC